MAIGALSDVIKHVRDLPSLPAVVMQLLSCIEQEDASSKVLAEKISRDLALTAKTLRLANSSFYGMQHEVSTIQQAIAVLGFDTVRTLVATVAVSGAFSANGSVRFNFDIFWRHSIATAICAKLLAPHMHVDRDSAFIAGLLHDIGRLILIMRYPDQYDEVFVYRATHNCPLLEAERMVLQIDHTQVGRALAEHWKFPIPIQEAIENHHQPDLSKAGPLACLIQIADSITYGLVRKKETEDQVVPLYAEAWNDLGISNEIYSAVFEKTAQQFEEVCQILVG